MATPFQTLQLPPLRDVRRARGLGIREVARRANIDVAQLSRVERGQSGLSVDSLLRLARALELKELEKLIKPYARAQGIIPTDDKEAAGNGLRVKAPPPRQATDEQFSV